MDWLSWIPALPSFNIPLPSSIQHRLVSFILKRFLGHFLQPGQLDAAQIESQLGSGHVQVKDLQLDPNPINALLVSTPLRLEEGTISNVTLQVPWPNPLNAVSGLTIQSLELTFVVSSYSQTSSESEVLPDSVTTVAETFLHTELSEREEAELRQSFHDGVTSKDLFVPGELNPFLDDIQGNDSPNSDDTEPMGISIFASLIERLLMNFQFVAENTKITVIFPGLSSFSVILPRLTYEASRSGSTAEDVSDPLTAKVNLSALFLSMRDLRRKSPDSGIHRSPDVMDFSDNESSSSSLDEQTHAAMSQSLAFLPVPPHSPASSMYESAVSWLPGSSPNDVALDLDNEIIETDLFTLGDGGLEVLVVLPPSETPHSIDTQSSEISLGCKVGSIACAIHSWQLPLLLQAATIWSSQMDSSQGTSHHPTSSEFVLPITIQIRSLNIIAVPHITKHDSLDREPLVSFFSHPSKAPPISRNYIRFRADTLSLNLTTSTSVRLESATFSLSDAHLVAFRWDRQSSPHQLCSVPIFIADPNLAAQYGGIHVHPTSKNYQSLPQFAQDDWLEIRQLYDSFKLSSWRHHAKGSHNRGPLSRDNLLQLQFSQTSPELCSLNVHLSPVHLRVDLDIVSDVRDLLFHFTQNQENSTGRSPHTSTEHSPLAPSHCTVDVSMEMARIQIYPGYFKEQSKRSGILVLDIYDFSMGDGLLAGDLVAPPSSQYAVSFGRICAGLRLRTNPFVQSFLSIGQLQLEDSPPESFSRKPAIYLLKEDSSLTLISVNLPSLHAYLSKPLFDGLQYFADALSQSTSLIFQEDVIREKESFENILGSRFLARSRGSVGDSKADTPSKLAAKVLIVEAFFRLDLADVDPISQTAALDFSLSDSTMAVDMLPSGKLILTAAIMDISINNSLSTGSLDNILSLTSPRRLGLKACPLVKAVFSSSSIPGSLGKESALDIALQGFTLAPPFEPDISVLQAFFKAPPGVFEAVVPSERTVIACTLGDFSIVVSPLNTGSSIAFHGQQLAMSTALTREPEQNIKITSTGLTVMLIDDYSVVVASQDVARGIRAPKKWLILGYAQIMEITEGIVTITSQSTRSPQVKLLVSQMNARLHLCADTIAALTSFFTEVGKRSHSPSSPLSRPSDTSPANIHPSLSQSNLLSAVESRAFVQPSEIGYTADLISDDLPTNLDYIDESFGAAAGLRELCDEDMDEFDIRPDPKAETFILESRPGISSCVGGETVKIFQRNGLDIVENHFLHLPPEEHLQNRELGDASFSLQIEDANVTVNLYDGYDWLKTRKAIEEETRNVRRKLARIRQLLASGHVEDPLAEDTSSMLFNSVPIGLYEETNRDNPEALIAAIDHELEDDIETATQSSWQSLHPSGPHSPPKSKRIHGRRLTRSRKPRVEFKVLGLHVKFDQYKPGQPAVSRTFASLRELEILDHITASTWQKFLTAMRSDSYGNVRETGSNMVQIELITVHPVEGDPSQEVRLRARILPLRLYVDQLAVEFLKQFFSFQAETSDDSTSTPKEEAYIQLAEVFPVDIKLDYKPRHVDYQALKAGRTIELMNFFHFDGAEMTLRHITLAGISGWPRLFDMLNDLWTPDVKATQLVDVISGVSPIRSVVNVGSGVADLVLLPIAQYKKDGRIIRGMQKGTTSFVKSAAIEAIKLGAQLATGTQVILEQTEDVLGGQFKETVLTEAMEPTNIPTSTLSGSYEDDSELISRYADQPMDIREGLQSAYHSMRRNLNSAAQTILAVPMEMHEREGAEGPVRSVIRAVPIAVLKPMIGATEAVSKTLLGLHNTLDPTLKYENEAKYKHRS